MRTRAIASVTLLIMLSVVMLFALIIPLKGRGTSTIFPAQLDFSGIVGNLSKSNVENHLKYFSSLQTRTVGYPGFYEAAAYIFNQFNNTYRLRNVSYENYSVTVAVDKGSKITILGENVTAYSIAPNLIQTSPTPPEGIEGILIDGGNGDFSNFDGKSVNGSIVIMNFNCRDRWLNAVMLGAKAIIFALPEETTRQEAEKKSTDVPLYVPRLLVSDEDGNKLRQIADTGQKIRIFNNVQFEKVEAPNIVGEVLGTDSTLSSEYIVVSAYFDSSSVSPAYSPGAQEACGISTLLEMARYFSANPLKRTVMFVATSGHDQALAGARNFVDEHFEEIGSKLKMMVSLNLLTDSSAMGFFPAGFFYRYQLVYNSPKVNWFIDKIYKSKLEIESQLGPERARTYVVEDFPLKEKFQWYWRVPTQFYGDAEPFVLSGGLGGMFVTLPNFEAYVLTPHDTYDRLVTENLVPQMEFISLFLSFIANEPSIPPYQASRHFATGGYTTLKIRVNEYNLSMGLWPNVSAPDALVHFSLNLPYQGGFDIIEKADANGYVEIVGLAPLSAGEAELRYVYSMEAFVLDEEGHILYAPDFGQYGAQQFSLTTEFNNPTFETSIVVFRCSSLALLGVLDPKVMDAPRFGSGEIDMSVSVFETATHAAPISYGSSFSSAGSDIMVYFPPESIIEVVIYKASSHFPYVLLINATADSPAGNGFKVQEGQTEIIYNTPFQVIDDIWLFNDDRIGSFRQLNVYSIITEEAQNKSTYLRSEALSALREKEYGLAYSLVYSCLSYIEDAYEGARGIYDDVITTTAVFFTLLIPFAFIAQQLIFDAKGKKQMALIAVIYGVALMMMYLFHPGFHLAANISLTAVGYAIVFLSIPVVLIVFGKFWDHLMEFRRKVAGLHYAEEGRLGTSMVMFSVGVSNMRKRAMRTALTLFTISLVTFALISFTSTSTSSIVKSVTTPSSPPYNGILVRDSFWNPIGEKIYGFLNNHFETGVTVLPRSWYYPPTPTVTGKLIYSAQGNAPYFAVLGLTPEESNLTHPDRALVNGSSWFKKGDFRKCILPDRMAETLGTGMGDSIIFNGLNLTVVGIMNETFTDPENGVKDIDGEFITPRDNTVPVIIHFPYWKIIIVPYELAVQIGGGLYSVAVNFDNANVVLETAKNLAMEITVFVYTGLVESPYAQIYQVGNVISVSGWQFLIVPFIISTLVVLTTMLGAVHERLKEIGTYGALGLSPKGVAYMFLAESLTYALLSGVIGYIAGTIFSSLLYTFNLVPEGLYLNYSSSAALFAVVISFLTILASSIYPVIMASRLVTPSMERVWKMTTPTGNEWDIPLPFAASEEEAAGILAYMKEYFESHSTERAGIFASSEVSPHVSKDKKIRFIKSEVRLAPYERGIRQEMQLKSVLTSEDFFRIDVFIKRIEGFRTMWLTSNRKFIDKVRKQLLLWRTLKPEEKKAYIEESKHLFGSKS